MSGLSLASHPPSGGRRAAPLRRKPRCLRARLVRLSCVPAFGVSPALLHAGRPCQGTRVLLRSHILLAHALWRGRSLCSLGGVPCWGSSCGRVCLRVAGVWCLRYCPCSLGVFACFGVCARLGVVGQSWSRRPTCPGLLACSRSGVGAVGVCAACVCPMGGGRPGRGAGLLRSPRGAWKRESGLGCSHGALTRAHAQREEGEEGEGSHVGRTVVAWAGVVGGGACGW